MLHRIFQNILHNWVHFVSQKYIWIVIISPILVAAVLFYTANNLKMNTDTRDMLSPELTWRKLDLEYERLFPHTTDVLVAVIEAPTPDQAIQAAAILYGKLAPQTDLFKTVFYLQGLPFIQQSSLLYMDLDELQDLSDQLAQIQPFLARLVEDQTLRGLTGMLEEAIAAIADGEEIDIAPIIQRFNQAILARLEQRPYQLSWHKLMLGQEDEKNIYREFILMQPILDYSNLLPAQAAITELRNLAKESDFNELGASLRLTGSAALSHEELETVSRANLIAIAGALLLVSLVMIIGLGSIWLVVSTMITLLTGLVLTAGFATWTVGELNLISVAFAVLYIGLGVDFAIHYCLRYREILLQGVAPDFAMEKASIKISGSLVLCAVTTAIGFYAFIPTDYDGVAELGWISGSGMFISLFTTMTLLPALLKLYPAKVAPLPKTTHYIMQGLLMYLSQHGRTIKLSALFLAVMSLLLVKDLSFDHNTLNLQPPENESVKTFKDLLLDKDTSPLTGVVLTKDKPEAMELANKLEQLSVVDKVVWLDEFIPPEQDAKLILIDEMNLLLGDLFLLSGSSEITNPDRLQTLSSLQNTLQNHLSLNIAGMSELNTNMQQYLQRLQQLAREPQGQELQQLEHSLIATLPARLGALEIALDTEGLTLPDLPDNFTERWKNQERYLVQIYPRENLADNRNLNEFVRQIQTLVPQVTGAPVVSVEAGKAVVNAFQHAILYAIAVISLLLLILLPHKIDAVYALIPLLLALLLTAATSVALNIPLNFANIIALPLLLGIGIDSAIHIIHRFRASDFDGMILSTSSARAVLISALTTITSIGNLAFSPHMGTASMGKLLTIGISMALLCTLLLLPSLLQDKNK